jgi:hypothetical protein
LSNLEEEFESDETLQQLAFLSLKSIRDLSRSEVEQYGLEGITRLAKNLSQHFIDENGEPILDEIKMKQEWPSFKSLARGQWMYLDEEGILKQLSSTPMLKNIRLLYEYFLVIPPNTAECERNLHE